MVTDLDYMGYSCNNSVVIYIVICSIALSPVAPPTVTVSPDTNVAVTGNNLTIQCRWDITVYCNAWYINDVMVYKEYITRRRLFFRFALSNRIYIESDFAMMTSTLTIDNATLDDSGNYTCAVTCGARGVNFSMIAANLLDTTEIFVYGEY